jgi:hypothetical protein
MPKATVDMAPQMLSLKSVEGGSITVRPLSYGQKKARADIATRMYSEVDEDQGKARDNRMYMDMLNRATTVYDFSHCILDHNLEDDQGRQLNFGNEATLDVLDPRIGTEIENILAKINGDDESLKDFIASRSSSQETDPTPVP